MLEPTQPRSPGLLDQTEVIPRAEAGTDIAETVQQTGPVDADVASDHGAPLIQRQPGDTAEASNPSAEQEQTAAATHDGSGEIPVTPLTFLQVDEKMMEPEFAGSAHVDQGDSSMPWSVPKRITRTPARFVSPVEVEEPQPPPHDDAIALRSLVYQIRNGTEEADRCMATGADIAGSFANRCMMDDSTQFMTGLAAQ
ncbi:hypothetical protein E2562_022132 [Oryza meyeriana var. granulata]|uniref:Uncharacterized protein n=1 Tax=Oryza meyeriana var. granulata TaxID=110450 RepID=A0A6G1BM58_9ORYZ|nr:hypothetical protein E2562_022132 [Oryza meyeriana var. granulata]